MSKWVVGTNSCLLKGILNNKDGYILNKLTHELCMS